MGKEGMGFEINPKIDMYYAGIRNVLYWGVVLLDKK
jgi:hypothetical protein